MDLTKVGKASEFLMKSEKAKEALIDAFGSGTMKDDIRNRLSLVQEIAEFCERDETEMILVKGVISSFLENRKPTPEDIRETIDILSECQKDLKDYVIEKTHLSSPRSEEFNEYYAAISEYVKAKEESKC
ncbi:MAG: hypothetical protein HXS46_19425 [Theionarchaea archaeon]|nr:hypothetical protein [Theionarchaea archaeon]